MSVLHNEIDTLTIGGIRNDVRDTYTREMISHTEPLEVASRDYDKNEFFISSVDRCVYRTLAEFPIGTTFTPGVNVRKVTVDQMLYELFSASPIAALEDLAFNEKTDYASKSYYINDFIIWKDGFLYQITQTINSGSQFVRDTNMIRIANISVIASQLLNKKEDKKVILTAQLSAGSTTLTFSDDSINNNSIIDVCTSLYGVIPKNAVQSGHTVTLTFAANTQSITVKLIIGKE